MPSPFISEAIVIVNPGLQVSPYNPANTRPDWSEGAVTRTTAYGFIAQRGLSDETDETARSEDGAKWGAVFNGNPPITQDSRVEYQGEVFRVVARPKKVGLRGRVRHVEVTLMPLGEAD